MRVCMNGLGQESGKWMDCGGFIMTQERGDPETRLWEQTPCLKRLTNGGAGFGNSKCKRAAAEPERKWGGRLVSQPSQDNDCKASGGRGRGVIRKPQVVLPVTNRKAAEIF